jgi:hypothetical protein
MLRLYSEPVPTLSSIGKALAAMLSAALLAVPAASAAERAPAKPLGTLVFAFHPF